MAFSYINAIPNSHGVETRRHTALVIGRALAAARGASGSSATTTPSQAAPRGGELNAPFGGELVSSTCTLAPVAQLFGAEATHLVRPDFFEPFTFLELSVRGRQNLTASLADFVKGHVVEGFRYEEHGNQALTSIKSTRISVLPRRLVLNLKRYEFDVLAQAYVKVHDLFEFPMELDLTDYTTTRGASSSSSPARYQLGGVVVQSGNEASGHYYSFVLDRETGLWTRRNDREVTTFDPGSNGENFRTECFGGKTAAGMRGTTMQDITRSAYILFYDRVEPTESRSTKQQASTGIAAASVPSLRASTWLSVLEANAALSSQARWAYLNAPHDGDASEGAADEEQRAAKRKRLDQSAAALSPAANARLASTASRNAHLLRHAQLTDPAHAHFVRKAASLALSSLQSGVADNDAVTLATAICASGTSLLTHVASRCALDASRYDCIRATWAEPFADVMRRHPAYARQFILDVCAKDPMAAQEPVENLQWLGPGEPTIAALANSHLVRALVRTPRAGVRAAFAAILSAAATALWRCMGPLYTGPSGDPISFVTQDEARGAMKVLCNTVTRVGLASSDAALFADHWVSFLTVARDLLEMGAADPTEQDPEKQPYLENLDYMGSPYNMFIDNPMINMLARFARAGAADVHVPGPVVATVPTAAATAAAGAVSLSDNSSVGSLLANCAELLTRGWHHDRTIEATEYIRQVEGVEVWSQDQPILGLARLADKQGSENACIVLFRLGGYLHREVTPAVACDIAVAFAHKSTDSPPNGGGLQGYAFGALVSWLDGLHEGDNGVGDPNMELAPMALEACIGSKRGLLEALEEVQRRHLLRRERLKKLRGILSKLYQNSEAVKYWCQHWNSQAGQALVTIVQQMEEQHFSMDAEDEDVDDVYSDNEHDDEDVDGRHASAAIRRHRGTTEPPPPPPPPPPPLPIGSSGAGAQADDIALFVERVDVIPVATHVCVHGVNKVMVKCCRNYHQRHHYQPLLQFRPSGGEGSSKKQAAEFDLHLSALMSAATSPRPILCSGLLPVKTSFGMFLLNALKGIEAWRIANWTIGQERKVGITGSAILTGGRRMTKEGANRNKPRDQRRDFVNARKRQIGQCADCDALVVEGYEHLFSFAHKDAATKDPRGSISRLVHLGCSIETIKKEIELCLLKCATCHNKETKDRRKDWSKVASSPPSYPTVAPPFGNHGGVVSQRRREQNRLAQRRSREKQREKALEARRQLEERVMAEDEEEESRKRQLALAEGELEGVPEAGEAVARSPSTEEDA
ncbi:hypothetical protein PPROV_000409600 [Pycnococcus provasolii]|uniref:USP domain-containing protein n=1 Tax=Pycnococcus provasolii TaxID=41880 RepID=A0A830HE65_9CHLO|nr:hypothetical protein PPROV_000409600 [Pycnococcus provasolii]